MLRLHYNEYESWNNSNAGKMLYRDRSHVVELLLHLEHKQQIIPNNVATQHKHRYSLYR